jgi:hypothetical protein
MIRTLAPVWERAMAVLMTVVVFPSAGFGLEMAIFLGGFPEKEEGSTFECFDRLRKH